MGRNWSCYPAGFTGPVREPVPAEPEVVGIDYERQLPANKSIYVGESAIFLLVFDPAEFICNENDFSTSDDDVTVTMEEGADNIVRISVGESVGAGSVVEVRFRDQLIMNVTAAEYFSEFSDVIFNEGSSVNQSAFNYDGMLVKSLPADAVIKVRYFDSDNDTTLNFVRDEGRDRWTTVGSDALSWAFGHYEQIILDAETDQHVLRQYIYPWGLQALVQFTAEITLISNDTTIFYQK